MPQLEYLNQTDEHGFYRNGRSNRWLQHVLSEHKNIQKHKTRQ